jgi:hypothetical protein
MQAIADRELVERMTDEAHDPAAVLINRIDGKVSRLAKLTKYTVLVACAVSIVVLLVLHQPIAASLVGLFAVFVAGGRTRFFLR